jgi:hypothetical protein
MEKNELAGYFLTKPNKLYIYCCQRWRCREFNKEHCKITPELIDLWDIDEKYPAEIKTKDDLKHAEIELNDQGCEDWEPRLYIRLKWSLENLKPDFLIGLEIDRDDLIEKGMGGACGWDWYLMDGTEICSGCGSDNGLKVTTENWSREEIKDFIKAGARPIFGNLWQWLKIQWKNHRYHYKEIKYGF